jgi:hypothetical protein
VKVERTSKGVTIDLDWSESEELMVDLFQARSMDGFNPYPITKELTSQLDEILGEKKNERRT